MLFLIDLSSRRVEIAGLEKGLWMSQVARNLSDAAEGFLVGKRYLIHDRDPLFTAEFLETLGTSDNVVLDVIEPRLTEEGSLIAKIGQRPLYSPVSGHADHPLLDLVLRARALGARCLLPSYRLAISFRCQAKSVCGVTRVASS